MLTLSLLLVLGCSTNDSQALTNEKHYSRTQQHLFQLLDNYQADYAAARLSGTEEEVKNKYLEQLHDFAVDSLGRYLDSITATVDTVVQEDWTLTTQLHARDIEFRYSMTFKENMPKSADSLYQFMRQLKKGEEVTVNFVHLGGAEINNPYDTTVRTIRIFAYPEPL